MNERDVTTPAFAENRSHISAPHIPLHTTRSSPLPTIPSPPTLQPNHPPSADTPVQKNDLLFTGLPKYTFHQYDPKMGWLLYKHRVQPMEYHKVVARQHRVEQIHTTESTTPSTPNAQHNLLTTRVSKSHDHRVSTSREQQQMWNKSEKTTKTKTGLENADSNRAEEGGAGHRRSEPKTNRKKNE